MPPRFEEGGPGEGIPGRLGLYEHKCASKIAISSGSTALPASSHGSHTLTTPCSASSRRTASLTTPACSPGSPVEALAIVDSRHDSARMRSVASTAAHGRCDVADRLLVWGDVLLSASKGYLRCFTWALEPKATRTGGFRQQKTPEIG